MLYFLVGFVIGMVASRFVFIKTTSGVLKIDHFDSKKDLYRFEIDDLDSLSRRKYISLKIDNDADLSQE